MALFEPSVKPVLMKHPGTSVDAVQWLAWSDALEESGECKSWVIRERRMGECLQRVPKLVLVAEFFQRGQFVCSTAIMKPTWKHPRTPTGFSPLPECPWKKSFPNEILRNFRWLTKKFIESKGGPPLWADVSDQTTSLNSVPNLKDTDEGYERLLTNPDDFDWIRYQLLGWYILAEEFLTAVYKLGQSKSNLREGEEVLTRIPMPKNNPWRSKQVCDDVPEWKSWIERMDAEKRQAWERAKQGFQMRFDQRIQDVADQNKSDD